MLIDLNQVAKTLGSLLRLSMMGYAFDLALSDRFEVKRRVIGRKERSMIAYWHFKGRKQQIRRFTFQ